MFGFVHLKAGLKQLANVLGTSQFSSAQTTQSDHESRKASFLEAADRFRWPAPQDYRFDRDEANER